MQLVELCANQPILIKNQWLELKRQLKYQLVWVNSYFFFKLFEIGWFAWHKFDYLELKQIAIMKI